MIEFMHEGGFGMWLTLAFFVVGTGAAVMRRARDGERWAYGGAIAVIASGLLGLSTGLYLTVAAAAGDAEVLGTGIRESANNTVFAAVLALVLAFIGLALDRKAQPGGRPVGG